MNRIIVIGSVNSTRLTLNKLVEYGFEVVGVLGYEPDNMKNISGWVDLRRVAQEQNVPFKGFNKINDSENIRWAEEKQPDIIFAIGFSQLLSEKWLQMPKLGCIGFHPTKLPKGRGRAPLAWLVLEGTEGSATFFLMGKGADDGPIFVQEEFKVFPQDDALAVRERIGDCIIRGLDKWLPELKKGIWNPIPQNEAEATWYGKRAPIDGIINWHHSAQSIDRLIKASSYPHPGAYTYFKDTKMIIWESEIERNIPIKGVTGRILLIDKKKGYLIQCGEGLLWIKNIEIEDSIKPGIGGKLGYNIEYEIFKLKAELKKIQGE